ncbi:SRPBCC family protein [Actinoplanes sp. NPDC048988]|uniref:type II toxin-antitoxin system Rv0910 family toxin n=1 Tax=Actinoplanes sp. NPDC048988 TaxID=3363901 RepID=UPI003713F528
MARAQASAEYSESPEAVWRTLTDLRRQPQWVAFHKQWIAEPPERPAEGATFKESVAILGPPATVDWEIVTVKSRELLELSGQGTTGVAARLVYQVTAGAAGSVLSIDMELTGGPVVGPIGDMIQDAAQKLVESSLAAFPAAR